MRKISYCICIALNFLRMPLLTLLSGFKILSSPQQLISMFTDIDVGKGGKISIDGRVHTEKNVLLSARNRGQLHFCGNAFVNRNSMIVCRKEITIGKGVTIGPNVLIYDHDHNMVNKGELICEAVSIGENTWIGSGCIILKGVTIGKNCVVAAGTILTKSVPDNTIVRNQISYITKEIY